MSWDGLDTSPLLFYLGEWTVKYSFRKNPFGMVSTLWCQIFSTLLYWGRRTNLKFKNIIVDTASTDIFPICSTYFYMNWRTKFKCINIFVGMVTHLKIIHNDPVQWPLYFLLDNVTIAPEMPKLPMIFLNIAINKTNFEYKWYDLCGLLCVDNYSSKSHLVMPVKYPIHIGIKLHSLFHESIWRKKICTWCLVNKEYAIIGQFYT